MIDSLQPLWRADGQHQYPLVCLDIDGVCSPVGQNPRFHCHRWPPGFIDCRSSVQIHPALPRWIGEIETAFATVCWISSWGENSGSFAESAGLAAATAWQYVDTGLAADAQTGIGRKLGGLAETIDPAAPVAVVDDHLAPQYPCRGEAYIPTPRSRRPYQQGREEAMDSEIARFLQRPGPTLLVAPASEVGLTRSIVDKLVRFARNPAEVEFAERRVLELDTDWWMQWPASLDPTIEDPVCVRPENESDWLAAPVAEQNVWERDRKRR